MKIPFRILVSDLACSRGERQLFKGLSFRLSGGQAMIVTGPNGVGKTTLLRVLSGFIAMDVGSIQLEGTEDGGTVAQSAHFVGHRDGLRAALTVRENLDLVPSMFGPARVAVSDAAARLNLTPLLDLPVGVLSAGQRRRAALARLLAVPRPIWLLDEPTSSLDAASQAIVSALISDHVGSGGMVVAATHLELGVAARQLQLQADGAPVLRELSA